MIQGLPEALARLAALNETTTYGALARDLGLQGPATIARLTSALEQLMTEDAAQNLPLRAALLCQRGSTLPAPGFFDMAAALGYALLDPVQFVAEHRQALHLHFGANTPRGSGGVKPPATASTSDPDSSK